MSSETYLRDLLTNMDPEIETKLLGSRAEFSRLSNTKPFTIDKVNQMSGDVVRRKKKPCLCAFVCIINGYLCVLLGHQQGFV